jgi:Uma2 family endonuclease
MDHATLASMLDAAEIAPLRIRPLKRREYDRLVELGAFGDEKIELLCGALVTMSPQLEPHALATEWLNELLIRKLRRRARLRPQLPLAISADSEPEPDIALVPHGVVGRGHPRTAHLVIEVADSSLAKDLIVKARVYALARVPEYWVVDLVHRVVLVHTQPSRGRYLSIRRAGPRESIRLVEFPDITVPLRELLRSPTPSAARSRAPAARSRRAASRGRAPARRGG